MNDWQNKSCLFVVLFLMNSGSSIFFDVLPEFFKHGVGDFLETFFFFFIMVLGCFYTVSSVDRDCSTGSDNFGEALCCWYADSRVRCVTSLLWIFVGFPSSSNSISSSSRGESSRICLGLGALNCFLGTDSFKFVILDSNLDFSSLKSF